MHSDQSTCVAICASPSASRDRRAVGPVSGPWIGCWKVEHRPRALDGVALAVVVQGNLLVRFIGGDVARLFEGDCFRLSPGVSCQLGGRDSRAELILFHADSTWAAAALALSGGEQAREQTAISVDRAGSERARTASRLLRERLLPPRDQHRDPLRETAASLELLTLALAPSLEGSHAAAARRAGAHTRGAFLNAIDALRESELADARLSTLAVTLGRSERQVARLFEQELGHSFREHLTRLRIDRAKWLLRTTTLRIVEVAEGSGWGSLAHFNETFRRRVGMTPTCWRASSVADVVRG